MSLTINSLLYKFEGGQYVPVEYEDLIGSMDGVVLYTAQSLSSGEQDQARENINSQKYKKDNYTATTPPTAYDDSNSDYEIGSVWVNTVADIPYLCVDNTAGAAVWSILSEDPSLSLDANAVKFSEPQSLSSGQKSQARSNISALGAADNNTFTGDNSFEAGLRIIEADFTNGESSVGTGAERQISLGHNGTVNYRHSISTTHNAGTDSGNKVRFWLWDAGTDSATGNASKNVMTLAGNGRVGIMEDSPDEALHIQSEGAARIKLEADPANSNEAYNAEIIFSQDGGAVVGYVGFETGTENSFRINSTANGPVWIGRSGTAGFYMNTSNNVGIGNTSPSQKLTVTGNITASGNNNTLPSQALSSNGSILTRSLGDARYMQASAANVITGDNVFEGLNKFTDNPTQFLFGENSAGTGTNAQALFGLANAGNAGQYRHAIYTTHHSFTANLNRFVVRMWDPGLNTINAVGSRQAFCITGGGRVGIGELSPDVDLHITNTGSARIKLEADTGNNNESSVAGIELNQDGGLVTAILEFKGDTTNTLQLGTTSGASSQIDILNNGSTVATFDSGGLDVEGTLYCLGDLTTDGDIEGIGTNNRLPSQVVDSEFSIITRKFIDDNFGNNPIGKRRWYLNKPVTGSASNFVFTIPSEQLPKLGFYTLYFVGDTYQTNSRFVYRINVMGDNGGAVIANVEPVFTASAFTSVGAVASSGDLQIYFYCSFTHARYLSVGLDTVISRGSGEDSGTIPIIED